MALGNKKSNAQTTSDKPADKPQFEEDSNTVVADKPKAEVKAEPQASAPAEPAAAETVTPEAEKVASTAVAKASTSSVATNEATQRAKAFQKELDDMRGASDFSFGNYRQFKAVQGEIQESGGEKDSLGRWAKVRLMSWDNHFEVSPGEEGASTKDFVAYSKDGKVIDQVIGEELKSWIGKSVEDYLAYLRDDNDGEGFDNAKCREFIDCGCALIGSDSGDGPVGTVIQVTLSESSMMAFNRYQNGLKDTARAAAMGIPGFQVPADPFTFYFLREAAEKGSKKWTKLKIVQELPTKL